MKSNDTRLTPPDLVAECAKLVGVDGFTLDVAASPGNQVNGEDGIYYSLENEDDGLKEQWHGDVWCNPPYSDIAPWLRKAWYEWHRGKAASFILGPARQLMAEQAGLVERNLVKSITMLLPANKTEQRWWQSYVERHSHREQVRVHFLAKRRRFLMPDGSPILARKDGVVVRNKAGVPLVGSPGFGLCVLSWGFK